MPPFFRWGVIICGLALIFVSGSSNANVSGQGAGTGDLSWFGAIEAHDAPIRADELGITWSRARFHWGSIQPSGPDDWIDAELTDEELDRELAAGREVIGLLIGIPAWARDEIGLPSGLNLPIDDDHNLWAQFVHAAVDRYAGRIDHWVIWNEPDIWDSEHPAFSWPGTEADFARLMEVSYRVIKETNPNAVVHLGAMSHFWDVLYGRELYFRRLLEILSADQSAVDNNFYYDVATLHLYFNPADVYDILLEYQQVQSEFGIDKPFWLVETNAPPSSDPAFVVQDPTFQVSLVEQAAYMPQALALSLAAGAERVGLYKMIDTPGDFAANPELFGLLRANGEPRSAYFTAQVAATLLDPTAEIEWRDTHVVSQVVVLGEEETTRILWVRVPFSQTVQIPALADSARVVDMWGNSASLSPDGDQYEIRLSAGECTQTVGDYCMIGGPPLFVIESASVQSISDSSLNVTVVEDHAGGDYSLTAPSISLTGLLTSVVVGLGMMIATVWVSCRLRSELN